MIAPIFALASTAIAASTASLVIESADEYYNGKGIVGVTEHGYFNIYTISNQVNTFTFDPESHIIYENASNPETGEKTVWDLFQSPSLSGVVIATDGVLSNQLAVEDGYVTINGTADNFYACDPEALLYTYVNWGELSEPVLAAFETNENIRGCDNIKIRANVQ